MIPSLEILDVGTNRLVVVDQFMGDSRTQQQNVVDDNSSYPVIGNDENTIANCIANETSALQSGTSGSLTPKSSSSWTNLCNLFNGCHDSTSEVVSPTASETCTAFDGNNDSATAVSPDRDYGNSEKNAVAFAQSIASSFTSSYKKQDSMNENMLMTITTVGPNGFVSMREQDAELLESIQLLSNDSLTTPCLTAALSTPLGSEIDDEIPILSLGDSYIDYPSNAKGSSGIIPTTSSSLPSPIDRPTQITRSFTASASTSQNVKIPYFDSKHDRSSKSKSSVLLPMIPTRHLRSRTGGTSTTANHILDAPLSSVDSSIQCTSVLSSSDDNKTSPNGNTNKKLLPSPMRRALSGEVWTTSNFIVSERITSETIAADFPSFVCSDPVVSCVDESPKPMDKMGGERDVNSSNAILRRSDSSERRLNETAQFAEAVGETLLFEDTAIQIIDDDDGPAYHDEDDDDETFLSNKIQSHRSSQNDCTTSQDSHFDIDCNNILHPLSMSLEDVTKQRQISEVALFASAVGEYELEFQVDPSSTILIIDDDELNDQHLDDDDDDDDQLVHDCKDTNSSTTKDKHPMLGNDMTLVKDETPFTEEKTVNMHGNAQEVHRVPPRHQRSFSSQTSSLPMNVNHSENSNKITPLGNRLAFIRRNRSTGFLDKLPDDYNSAPATAKQLDFVYKGIQSNPPEIVKRGIARGNYAQLHRKAWLEVSDKYHRYGKNLRLYYRFWESLGFPTNIFFDWLDSKGDAAGQPLPELEECPRSKLDSDTVLYITNPKVTESYQVLFLPTDVPTYSGRCSGKPLINEGDSPESWRHYQSTKSLRPGLVVDVNMNPVRTGPEGWIFVLRDNKMYGAPKVTSIGNTTKMQQHSHGAQSHPSLGTTLSSNRQQRFHHSSFFGGKAVAAAGIFITDDSGILTRLYPHSGHYRPGEAHMQRVLFFLYHQGIDLRTFEMDIQQILHVARGGSDVGSGGVRENNSVKPEIVEKATITDGGNRRRWSFTNHEAGEKINSKPEKKKKLESLHLMPAILVACFLAHKARFIGEGIFAQIHKIRRRGRDITNVTEALNIIDEGGCFWSSNMGTVSQHNPTNTPGTVSMSLVTSKFSEKTPIEANE